MDTANVIKSYFLILIISKCSCHFEGILHYKQDRESTRFKLDRTAVFCDQKHKGSWCEWEPWGPCSEGCVRYRRRECRCPEPSDFEKEEFRCNDGGIQKEETRIEGGRRIVMRPTRLVWRTMHKGTCIFPNYQHGRYYINCKKKEECFTVSETIAECHAIIGQEEHDISACSGWITKSNRASMGLLDRVVFNASSHLGQHCDDRTVDDTMGTGCVAYYDFTLGKDNKVSRQSDFGRSVELAYNRENCRFVCSVHPRCVSIDFTTESHCILNLDNLAKEFKFSVGSLYEERPEVCNTMTLRGENLFEKVIKRIDAQIELDLRP